MHSGAGRLEVGEGFRGPAGHVGYLLRQAQSAFNDAMAARLRQHGLTPRQYATLTVLVASGPVSVSELARRTLVTPQSAHETTRALVDSGLIARRPHPTHGRVLLLEPTARGRALVDRARPVVDELEERTLAGLDPAERETVLRWLVDAAVAAHADAEPAHPRR